MANVTYDRPLTALLVIDPFNDFISEGGKVWDRLKAVRLVHVVKRFGGGYATRDPHLIRELLTGESAIVPRLSMLLRAPCGEGGSQVRRAGQHGNWRHRRDRER